MCSSAATPPSPSVRPLQKAVMQADGVKCCPASPLHLVCNLPFSYSLTHFASPSPSLLSFFLISLCYSSDLCSSSPPSSSFSFSIYLSVPAAICYISGACPRFGASNSGALLSIIWHLGVSDWGRKNYFRNTVCRDAAECRRD